MSPSFTIINSRRSNEDFLNEYLGSSSFIYDDNKKMKIRRSVGSTIIFVIFDQLQKHQRT